MRYSRGVVLLHTLIMLMVMAYISVLLLQWTLSRAVASRTALNSNENTELLSALQAKISTCLSPNTVSVPANCVDDLGSRIGACMNDGGQISYRDINGLAQPRYYKAIFCSPGPTDCPVAAQPCPCKIQILLCPPRVTDCGVVTCATPVPWTKL